MQVRPYLNRSIQFIRKTLPSTFVGLLVLAVLLGIGACTLKPIINILYPLLPPCPPGPAPDFPCYTSEGLIDFGQNSDKYIVGTFILYFVSICVAGFVAGYYVHISRMRAEADDTTTGVWQSLISGAIIGAIVPLLISIVSNRSTTITEIFFIFAFGIPAMVTGIIGYKFHSYRRYFINTPKRLIITYLGMPILLGLIVYMVLRALFDPIIDVDCSILANVQGLFVDVCTESEVAFGIILFMATVTAGWWAARTSGIFKFSVISGLMVGVVGPLLGSYLASDPTPAAYYFFYGMWGGLFGLCGSAGRHARFFWPHKLSSRRIKGLIGVGILSGCWLLLLGLKPCGRLDIFLKRSGCVQRLSGHKAEIGWIAMALDGDLVAAGATDQTVKVWRKGMLLHILNIGHAISPLNFSQDGTVLAVASRNDGLIQLWDTDTGQLQHHLEHDDWIGNIAFSPNGKLLAVAARSTKLWQVDSGRLLIDLGASQTDFDSSAYSIAFSADGKILATGSSGRVSLWNVEGCTDASQTCGQFIGLIDALGERAVYSVAFSPQGDRLAAGLEGLTQVWQIDDCSSTQKCDQLIHTFKNKNEYYRFHIVAFSPDGTILAENSNNQRIRIRRLSDGALVHDYHELPRGIHSLLFTVNNTILVAAPIGHIAQVWQLVAE